jgi:hypothetical protein
MQSDSTTNRRTPHWRISVDRAWRSEPLRRKFESECGLSPLAKTQEGTDEEAFSGTLQTYQESFLLWATKHLGLADEAPPDIRRKLRLSGHQARATVRE